MDNLVYERDVQRLAEFDAPGLVNVVHAVAYHFCLNLPAAFSQPGKGLLEIPCNIPERDTNKMCVDMN